MKIVDLSRELYHKTPTYPGHPPVIHGVWTTHEESFVASGHVHGLSSMYISMPDHAGTHIDAPRHFNKGGQPILIYGADRPALTRALERALARNVKPAVYTEDMFKTTHDAANRDAVKAVIRAELNLVGLAMRAERKVIDKIVDGLKFHA